MKVLHVECGMHLYGGARQVLYLLDGLRGSDVESVLACPAGSEIALEAGDVVITPPGARHVLWGASADEPLTTVYAAVSRAATG